MDKKRYIWRPYFVLLTLAMAAGYLAFYGWWIVVHILEAFGVETTNFTSWGGWLTLIVLLPILRYAFRRTHQLLRPRLQPVSWQVRHDITPEENPKLCMPDYAFTGYLMLITIGMIVGWVALYDEVFGLPAGGNAMIRFLVLTIIPMAPWFLTIVWGHRNIKTEPHLFPEEDQQNRETKS